MVCNDNITSSTFLKTVTTLPTTPLLLLELIDTDNDRLGKLSYKQYKLTSDYYDPFGCKEYMDGRIL